LKFSFRRKIYLLLPKKGRQDHNQKADSLSTVLIRPSLPKNNFPTISFFGSREEAGAAALFGTKAAMPVY